MLSKSFDPRLTDRPRRPRPVKITGKARKVVSKVGLFREREEDTECALREEHRSFNSISLLQVLARCVNNKTRRDRGPKRTRTNRASPQEGIALDLFNTRQSEC